MHFNFDRIKASQVCYDFIRREGGRMDLLKLMKLIYILDRRAIERRGMPVVGGVYYSMKHGPVIEDLLDLINFGDDDVWSRSITDREDHAIATSGNDPGDLNISRAEKKFMDEIWREFGHMDKWQLRDWTHEHIPEWEERTTGRSPIPIEKMAEALGFSDESIRCMAADARSVNAMDAIFA